MKKEYPPLSEVNVRFLTTDQAAFYLNRRPQTLRSWAGHKTGPCMPVKMMGRLAWKVKDIEGLLETGWERT